MRKIIYIISGILSSVVNMYAQVDYEKINLGGFDQYSMTICSGDIDSDGDIDVLSTDSGGVITWVENTGNMYFKPMDIHTDLPINKMKLIDFDNDNDLDILTWSLDSNILGVLIQNSNMQFQDSVLSDSLSSLSVIVTNFDSNDFVDILFQDFNNNLNVIQHTSTVNIIDSNIHYTPFDIVDYDNDGDMDIVDNVRTPFVSSFYQFLTLDITKNQGNNTFVTQTLSYGISSQVPLNDIPPDPGASKKIKIADINNDGNLEIITLTKNSGFDDNYLSVYFINNDSISRIENLNIKAKDFKLGHFNSDDKLDILVSSNPYTWYGFNLNKYIYTDSNFIGQGVASSVSVTGLSTYCKSFNIIDINQDSIDDIFYSTVNRASVESEIHTSYGSVQNGFIHTPILLNQRTPVLFNTIGKNFIVDKQRNHAIGNEYLLFLNNINGVKYTFHKTTNYYGVYPTSYVNYVDIDNDNDLDIINGSYNTYNRRLFINNQSVIYPENSIIDQSILDKIGYNPQHYETTRLKDIDLDGDLDFFITNSSSSGASNEISWYKRIGAWTFQPQNTLVVLPDSVKNYFAEEMSDLNGDNLFDFILINKHKFHMWDTNSNDTIGILKNVGFGDYELHQKITCHNYLFSEDLDLDGDLDIIAQDSLYINDGNFNFVSLDYPAEINQVYGFKDYDYDNDIDFFAKTHSNQLKWFINDGNLNYTSSILISDSLFESEARFIPIDYLNDGDWDILSYGGNTPFLYENTSDFYVSVEEEVHEGENPNNLLLITPNPTHGYLKIDTELDLNSVTVYNQLGQVVLIKKINTNAITLDLSMLKSGIYNLQFTDDNQRLYSKSIILKK